MDETKPTIRYKLRSSLKRSSKNPLGSLDVSDEGDDTTLHPAPRRVSFAASSTVKPFVNDPEKNTIWDNTYEEEINHTDSNHVLSLDSHSNIHEIQRVNINFNQSLANLEDTLKDCGENNMELTNCFSPQKKSKAEESMELTCQWKNNIIDNNKVSGKISKNMLEMSKANCTQIQEVNMSLTTCGLAVADKENIQFPITYATHYDQKSFSKKTLIRQKPIEPFADKSLLAETIKDPMDMELTCKSHSEPEAEPMEIDETVKTYKNCSIYQEGDMSLTCKFSNVIINTDQVFLSKKIDTNMPRSMQNSSDMEFTCTFPPENENGLKNHHTIDKETVSTQSGINQSVTDMKFARLFPQDNMELQKTLNSTRVDADMEFTCQFSAKQILQKTQKVAELVDTCFPPEDVKENGETGNISEANHADVNQSSVDMEFTCKFPQNTMEQTNKNDVVRLNVAPIQIELSNAEFCTSQPAHENIPLQENANNELSKTCQLNTNMEFSCIIPQTDPLELLSVANKNPITIASSDLGMSNVSHSVDDKKLADRPKRALKTIDIYTDDDTVNPDNIVRLYSQETNKTIDVQRKSQETSQLVNKENIYSTQELKKNLHDHSSFHLNFTSKTLLMAKEQYNEIDSIAHTSSIHKPKLEMEDTINVSLPEIPEEKSLKVIELPEELTKELPNVPIVTECADQKINHSIEDKASSCNVQNENHVIPIEIANLNLVEQAIVVSKEDSIAIPDITETEDISFSKECNKNETIAAEECTLIDTLNSIIVDEDLPEMRREECATPPKVIYSEPMKTAKPSTSMFDFSNGLSSGKKPFNFNSLTSIMDGTQQLIEATFSKPTETPNEVVNNSLLKNESGLALIDNTIEGPQSAQNSFDQHSTNFNTSSVRVQKILDNIENKIVKYEKPQLDFEDYYRLLQESQNLVDKAKYYLENCNSPEPQSSSLDEQVRKLSLANSSYNCSNSSETMSEDADDDNINNGDVAVHMPKTLNERISEVCNSVEEHILKIQHNEENYYIFSAFSQGVWFSVEFHPEDGRVTGIKTIVGLKKDSTSLYPSMHKFILDYICKKLELCNLKSSLGSCFDVLSLLDHVIIITESSLEFCMEFIEANRQYKTLRMESDGRVSFQILVTNPPIWWTVQFKMASIENIDQNSLEATAKYGAINEDHLRTILRNTEPGIECIRRFVGGVKEYFGRTQSMKLRSKDMNIKVAAV